MRQGDQENEVKFLVTRLGEVKRRLLSQQARLIQARTLERNLRFDTPEGTFQKEGRVLRLRRDSATRLTYKGPGRREAGALTRREIEFTVGEFDAARDMLLALGYGIAFVYEKFRTTYSMGDVEVMLDELPYGDFVEIEGGLTALHPAAEALGLDWTKGVVASYHDLFERLHSTRALGFGDLTFANFAGISLAPADLGVSAADQ